MSIQEKNNNFFIDDANTIMQYVHTIVYEGSYLFKEVKSGKRTIDPSTFVTISINNTNISLVLANDILDDQIAYSLFEFVFTIPTNDLEFDEFLVHKIKEHLKISIITVTISSSFEEKSKQLWCCPSQHSASFIALIRKLRSKSYISQKIAV